MHGSPRIRLATDDDAAAIAAIYSPHVAGSPTSFEIDVPTHEDMRMRIAETLRTHPWLVYEEEGTVGGYAYATKHRARAAYQWSVETSVYVDERFRRRRIGQALYVSLFRVLHTQGFVNAYAGITLPNAASVGLHESVGFTAVGVYRHIGYKLGAWHDVGWWQRALRERPSAPAAPLPLGEIAARSDLGAIVSVGLSTVRPRASR